MSSAARRLAVAGLALLTVVAVSAAAAGDGARPSAWQGGPLHDGYSPATTFAPPLSVAWRAELSDVSHAVVGPGRVFVLSGRPRGDFGTVDHGSLLHALDDRDGRTLWTSELAGTSPLVGHAFDQGRVVTVGAYGVVSAVAADDGATLWQVQLDQRLFSGPPVVVGGIVFVAGAGSGGTLYALDAASGRQRWSQPVVNGDHSSPTVTDDAVHVSYACGHTHAFRRDTGEPLWERTTACSGGGGRTSVLHQGRLYVRDSAHGAVLDARTGSELATFPTAVAPAFHAGTGFFVEEGGLSARDATTGTLRWTGAASGLITPPVVAAGHVYVGGQDRLFAFRESDGRLVWEGAAPVDEVDEHNAAHVYDGLAADGDRLYVSGRDTLTAFTGVRVSPDPSPTATRQPSPSPSPSRGPLVLPTCLPVPLPLPGCS